MPRHHEVQHTHSMFKILSMTTHQLIKLRMEKSTVVYAHSTHQR